MKDRHGRSINYLRLSVTDRCNLRCLYCMPEGGVPKITCGEVLRYEDLLRIAAAAANLGIEKIRVTGGEPLVRKGIVGFLERLAVVPGIQEVTLTTNGILLEEMAEELWKAGVARVNVSLDSLDQVVFAEITRGGDLKRVQAGLAAAERVGMKIKINVVAMRGVNDREIVPFASLSLYKPWSIRFIEYMPTIREERWEERLVSGAEILALLQRNFQTDSISGGLYCGPARPYRIAGALGTIGIISPMSAHFCGSCNRIRVTSTGLAKSCLFSGAALDLKPYLNSPGSIYLERVLQQVIAGKPARHHLGDSPEDHVPFRMADIGG